VVNSLYMNTDELEKIVFDRYERYKEVEQNEVMYEEYMMDDAEICIVAYGVSSRVARTAIMAAREKGIKVGMIRPITLWPFPKEVLAKAADQVKAFICVELSTGQMIEDIQLAISCKKEVHLANRTGGVIITPDEVLAKIEEVNGGAQ